MVNLDVNYGSLGANTLIDIYDEFPETMNADGDPSTNGTPLCRVLPTRTVKSKRTSHFLHMPSKFISMPTASAYPPF